MGRMTIDDDIEMLEYIHGDYRGCRIAVALENTINNLRKYQKIQELLDDGWNRTNAAEMLLSIEEVIETGNDD